MYFLPLISYCLTSSIRKESFIYSMYFIIVVFDILLFFTDLKVLLSLVGLVNEPILDDKIFNNSSSSSLLFLMLYLFLISVRHVSSNSLFK